MFDRHGRIIAVVVVVVIVAAGGVTYTIFNDSQRCVGIASVAPSIAVKNYKGYDIWTKPFSGIACPATDTSPTYQLVQSGTNPQAPSSIVRGGFSSVQSAKNYVDGLGMSKTPIILSYNFQVNKTSGTLAVAFKNYGNATVGITTVYFDQTLIGGPSITFDAQYGSKCGSYKVCSLTLYFGGDALPLPSQSTHTLRISTNATDIEHEVIPGEIYHAGCTYDERC